jgi:hypothetical protein
MEFLVIDRQDAHNKLKHLSTADFPDIIFSFQENYSKYSFYFQMKIVSVHSNISHCQILCLCE